MPNLKHSKFMLIVPAVLVMLLIYPIGINTFLSSKDYFSVEIDAQGPAMQLEDISRGYSRENPARTHPLFHSIVISAAYVPYIWARTQILPPYDIDSLDKRFPFLKGELIILMRLMNLLAAIGILLVVMRLMSLFKVGSLPAFLISLAVAFNADLMFQSSVTYCENWSVFWAMLSVVFFVKSILEKKKTLFCFSAFLVVSSLAVSSHERMAGYYIFTVPFLTFMFFNESRKDKRSVGRAALLTLAAIGIGFIALCLANNIFKDGFKAISEYLRFKTSVTVNVTPGRLGGFLGFLDNQFRCQRCAIWIIVCNMGGVIPFFSLYGIWSVFKKRLTPAIAMLLFPIGYQILTVGLPGWTSGRYVMGQTIFVIIYAGFGIAFLMEYAKKRGLMALFWVVIISALISELFFMASAKFMDFYYNPYRAVERVIKDPANNGRKIIILGMDFPQGLYRENNTIYEVVSGEAKARPEVTVIVSDSRGKFDHPELRKKEFRNPPRWLAFLAHYMCNLYIQSYPVTTSMTIERYSDGHK